MLDEDSAIAASAELAYEAELVLVACVFADDEESFVFEEEDEDEGSSCVAQ